MTRNIVPELSRRERQIMDLIYERGQATALEVREGIPAPPGYSAVRALLAILVDKGLLDYQRQGARYVYRPIRPKKEAGKSAIRRVLRTFYGGSVESAVAALLSASDAKLSREQLDRIEALIEQTRKEGR